jgi:hypothetical protein
LLVSTKKTQRGVIETGRKIVPLSEGAAYPEFRGPGDYTVVPVIVTKDPDSYTKRGLHGYAVDVLYKNGKLVDSDENILGDPIDVHVPEGLFGKIPPRWVSKWANLWFDRPPRDQCAFRRRCLLAFTVQPIVLSLWLILTTVVRTGAALLLTLGLGTRKVNFSAIFHPWINDCEDVWSDIYNPFFDSIFWTNSNGDAHSLPLVSLTPAVGVAGFFAASVYTSSFSTSLMLAGALMFGPIVAILVLALVVGGVAALWGIRPKFQRTKTERPYDKAALNALAPVICPGDGTKPDPLKQRRSIRLWYADMKAKVCKPYAHVEEN